MVLFNGEINHGGIRTHKKRAEENYVVFFFWVIFNFRIGLLFIFLLQNSPKNKKMNIVSVNIKCLSKLPSRSEGKEARKY